MSTAIDNKMDDPLAQLRRIYPAARLYPSNNRIVFKVKGTVASVQTQEQQCDVTVRNSVGVISVVVRKSACPDYCWAYLVSTKPYCSQVEIVWAVQASDSAPGGVETEIISLTESYIPSHLQSLTYGSWGKQLPELEETILKYVNKYPQIKQADIIRRIYYENQATIRKHLHELVQNKKIKKESDKYMPVDYNFDSKVAALYCEGGSTSDAPEHTSSRGQPTPHEPEAKQSLEIMQSCIDKNIRYYKRLQNKLPEYDFAAKWTILLYVSNYPNSLNEMIVDEANYDGKDRYSIRGECAIMCDAILYELRDSGIEEDIECMLKYTVERILEHILPVDVKAQKLKYDNPPKNKHKSRTLKDLERERKNGLKDLQLIQNNLKCRLPLSEFKTSLEKLQEKYQNLYCPPDTGGSKKAPKHQAPKHQAPKHQAPKRSPDLESKITELIIQEPGIRQRTIMEKFKHECPKTTIERWLKSLQAQGEIMRLPGFEARYVVTDCSYTQDIEKLLIFHIGRIVDYLEGMKAGMPDYTDAVKLSILEHMVSGHYKKIDEEVERRTTKLKRAFQEINDYSNKAHRLLENNKHIVEKQEWARVIDKIRLKQRKYTRDAMKLEAAVHDRKNIEKIEQVSLQHQVSHLAYSDTEKDMRVIRLTLRYESDPTVLERTLDEMRNRYGVRNATEIEDVVNMMLDIEPQIFTTRHDLLETIMTIKHRMDASRTYRPYTIDESDGQPEFTLPHIDSCIQARKRYSEYRSMWDTIKNWRDAGTYDTIIAPLVDEAANLDQHHDIDFNVYEE